MGIYKVPMFKRILLPLDGSIYSDAATRRACEIGLKHGAEITGLVVLNIPELISEDKLPFNTQLLDLEKRGYFKRKAQAQERIDGILQKFRNACEGHNVCHREAELQGIPAQCILEESVYYDLIVMGMKTHFHLDPDEEGNSMGRLLDHAVVPILAVPSEDNGRPFQNVLVAFNGSFHSARALREFVELSEPYETKISLLMSDKDEEHAGHCLHEGLQYLHANGIHEVNQIRTEKEIVRAVEEDFLPEIDLIVAGIHSKSAFKQFFVGSFIKHFIHTEKVPLFLG
jgi:nucleotide-binding universal stress UspA family protein